MIQLQHIHSLTDFQRNVKTHLKRMKKTGQAQVLTVNGKAEFVVQDAASYQRMLDALETAEVVAVVKASMERFARGEGKPALETLKKLKAKHDLQYRDHRPRRKRSA